MKKLTTLIFIVLIAFISYDGRDRKHKTNVEVLKENKLLDSFSERVKFIPESYAEVVTDTILSNGFKIRIKAFSDMSNAILNEHVHNKIKHKEYHRKIVSRIIIEKDEQVIFNKLIDDSFINKQLATNNLNHKDYILNPVEVDQMKSLESNHIVLITSLASLDKHVMSSYNIVIDTKGKSEFKKIDYAGT